LAALKPALVFIGFMGAGKTTALAAAREAGLDTTEVDELMERALGMPIAEAFAREGEESFRAREREVVGDLLERADGGAIALGGGSVLSERVREALGRHIVVWLEVSAEEAWRRIAGTERPLARSEEDVRALLARRRPLYEALADAIVMPSDRGVVARALPAIRALGAMPPGTRLLWAAGPTGDYPVLCGEGLLDSGWWPLDGRRFCVTDTTVASLHGGRVAPVAATIEVEPGEQAKTLAEAERVLRELAAAGMTRADHVVALGGGVVGDLAGFCAHTYQRGVAVVQVPTTLAAQVDSAYGGKTGVDLPEAKNYVGAYHMPTAVLADWATISTLPAAEIAAGFVEVLKTGLLAGGSLWSRLREIEPAEVTDHGWIAFACARYKCEVVAADERDSGRRQMLNLGHTIGHAIEAATGYSRYRHGEAVGLGLLAALRLSGADALRDDVLRLLEAAGLPVRIDSSIEVDAVLEAVGRDKKRTAEGVPFVLLEHPGQPVTGQVVEAGRVRAAVEELRDG
jgi:shikimate kinase / 3-dehydroquinate synthase